MTSTDKIMGFWFPTPCNDCGSHQRFDKILSRRGNSTLHRNVVAHETHAVSRPRRLSSETYNVSINSNHKSVGVITI